MKNWANIEKQKKSKYRSRKGGWGNPRLAT